MFGLLLCGEIIKFLEADINLNSVSASSDCGA
jgi:hypothetical protein